jgi:hypothetical protein
MVTIRRRTYTSTQGLQYSNTSIDQENTPHRLPTAYFFGNILQKISCCSLPSELQTHEMLMDTQGTRKYARTPAPVNKMTDRWYKV